MGQPWGSELHTLAQFARRAGISEGRARALASTSPSGLPEPDRYDAGSKPLWWSATVDSWCARTGRAVPEDAMWLFTAGQAEAEPVELRREVTAVAGRWPSITLRCFVIVWDTPHGHVVYLQPLDGDSAGIGNFALSLLEPRWWNDAVVVVPAGPTWMPFRDEPVFNIYRLTADPSSARNPAGEPSRPFTAVRRWLAQLTDPLPDLPDDDPDDDPSPGPGDQDAEQRRARLAAGGRAEWVTTLDADQIARPLGTRLPVWIDGTLTEATVRRTLAYRGGTITVPLSDTAPYGAAEWNPGALDRARSALDHGIDERYPAGWAVLASDTRDGLDALRTADGATPDHGPGWYLAARPALPDVPVNVETRLRDATPATDLTQVAREITELHEQIAELRVGDPLDGVYTEMFDLLRLQLGQQLKQLRTRRGPRPTTADDIDTAALEAVLDHTTIVPVSGPWSGPVVEEWQESLCQVADTEDALRLRRVQNLLAPQAITAEKVNEVYQDPAGRYVVVWTASTDRQHVEVEWPASLDPVAKWTDRTVLAADHEHGATLLFALTPTPDGEMRVDPFPLPRRELGGGAFAYGYPGGTPTSTFNAIARAVLGRDRTGGPEEVWTSPLWNTLSTATGPLRLTWPQVSASLSPEPRR